MSLNWLLKTFSEEDEKPKVKRKEAVSLTGILQRKRLLIAKKKGPREASLTFSPYNVGYGFCMREKVAQRAGLHKIMVKGPTPKEQLIFDVGNKYHEIIQRYFWKAGILEGYWRCNFCTATYDHELEFWDRSPEKCYQCGHSNFLEYREVPLKSEQYQISGRADGVLAIEVTKDLEERHLVDVKSISNQGRSDNPQDPRLYFESLEEAGPALTHQVQLMCYMLMSNIHDGHLLYVGKNGHQMKSFHIKYNEALLKPYLDDILTAIDWANDIKNGRRELPAPCSAKKCECQEIIMQPTSTQ